MNIIICRADELSEKHAAEKPVAILTIEHPGIMPGDCGYAPRFPETAQKILSFWDSEVPVAQGPEMKLVEEGISFVMEHIARGPVIIHCHAGKARSCGIALGVLALLHPDEDETKIIDRLITIRPQAAPNIIVVELADKIAGRGGKLLQAVKDHPLLTEQRTAAEKGRQEWMRRDPETAHRLFPEKFPKPGLK